MELSISHYQEIYNEHIKLYKERKETPLKGLFNLELSNLYACKLISEGVLDPEQHELNLLD